jgi:hypothetical protein
MIESIHLSTMDMLGYIPGWIVAVLFFVPFCGGIILYFYKTRHARSWRKGIYPASLKFNQDNLLEAYLAIGSLLILIDYQRSKGKTTFTSIAISSQPIIILEIHCCSPCVTRFKLTLRALG